MRKLLISAAVLSLSGCATIIEGTDQEVTVNSTPECVRCEFEREGKQISTIECTPQTIKITKTKHPINVTCYKKGYEDTSEVLESGVEAFVAGNIIAGGVVGWAVDSATGADNKYPEAVTINMVKK